MKGSANLNVIVSFCHVSIKEGSAHEHPLYPSIVESPLAQCVRVAVHGDE